MADFPSAEADVATLASPFPGRVAAAYGRGAPATPYGVRFIGDSLPALGVFDGGVFSDTGSKSVFAEVDHKGAVRDDTTPAIDWFEDFHVVPRSFELGNILSTQQINVEVYSAFRDASHSWTAWNNNAGQGVELIGEPALPYVFPPQTGKQMQLQISTSGPPTVDTNLEWVFDIGTILTPIDFERVVLFSMPPEMPYSEFLEFLTEVMPHKDGSEQRHALRKNPRQFFEWDLMLDEGPERTRMENTLFDWQTRVFGVPVWHELTRLSTSATAGATTFSVSSTAFADYRVDGLVLIYESQTKFDVLTVSSFTSNSITVTSGLLNSYTANVIVCPLRTGVLQNPPAEARYHVGASRLRAIFRILDNDSNLASTAAWSLFNSKVILTDLNVVNGTMGVEFDQDLVVFDNGTGITFRDSSWPNHRRGSVKTFITNSQQGLWNIRQLMHALRGRQVSFYLPTFSKDLALASNIVNGTGNFVITHVNYAQFVRHRQPRNIVRVVPNNGVSPIIKTVTNSVAGPTTETLTVDSNWAVGLTPAEIERIEFVEKVRLDSDRIRFDYNRGDRIVKVSSPVKAVLE